MFLCRVAKDDVSGLYRSEITGMVSLHLIKVSDYAGIGF